MYLNSVRVVEPLDIMADLKIDDSDLNLAFTDPMDEEEVQLFSDVFSPAWNNQSISEKLANLSLVAKRVEDARDKLAKHMTFETGTEVPKGDSNAR